MNKDEAKRKLLEELFPGTNPDTITEAIKKLAEIDAKPINAQEKEPPLGCLAFDNFVSNPAFIPSGIVAVKKNGKTRYYDKADFAEYFTAEDIEARFKQPGGLPREICYWLPLPYRSGE